MMNRLFLVGCPRSGTTLLQSMIASHSQIVSFPETHFFSKTLSINPVLRRLKLYGERDRNFIRKFLAENQYHDLDPFHDVAPTQRYFHNSWCRKLISILDEMACHNRDTKPVLWLEKTPRHLQYMKSIIGTGADMKFLHILRNGEDVVASMHLATKRHPKEWGGARSVNKCIRWWNNCIKISKKYKDDPRHVFVIYEQLVANPVQVLKAICEFISVDYEPSMATKFHKKAPALIARDEKWKDRNMCSSLKKSDKLHKNFDSPTIQYISHNVYSTDLDQFCNYL